MFDDWLVLVLVKNNNVLVWNFWVNQVVWDFYLGDLLFDKILIYVVFGWVIDLVGLLLVIIYVGDFDFFLDEICLYVKCFECVGIFVVCKVFDGCYYGFD